jgi:hypothetical protein
MSPTGGSILKLHAHTTLDSGYESARYLISDFTMTMRMRKWNGTNNYGTLVLKNTTTSGAFAQHNTLVANQPSRLFGF